MEKKPKGITDEELIEIAAKAYGDPLPLTYREAREHKSGDGLADFIVIELVEGTEGEKLKPAVERLERAVEVIGRARHQLQLVEDFLIAESVRRECDVCRRGS